MGFHSELPNALSGYLTTHLIAIYDSLAPRYATRQVPASDPVFQLVAVDWLRSDKQLVGHVASHPRSVVQVTEGEGWRGKRRGAWTPRLQDRTAQCSHRGLHGRSAADFKARDLLFLNICRPL